MHNGGNMAQNNDQPQSHDHAATRNTIQRALVLEAVQSLHNHPTSAEVYEAVREKYPNISRATVYRNLGVLARQGEILRIEVPDGADRYDYRCTPHFHALCRECGGVFDIEMSQPYDLGSSVSDTHGFAIEGCEILFEGVCPACQAQAESKGEGKGKGESADGPELEGAQEEGSQGQPGQASQPTEAQ